MQCVREAHLQWAEVALVILDDLWWQVLQHVFLDPPQQEGEDLTMQSLHRKDSCVGVCRGVWVCVWVCV